MSDVQHAELFDDLSGEHQQQQEERQKKALEALIWCEAAFKIALGTTSSKRTALEIELLDFLASECGVSEQWRKR